MTGHTPRREIKHKKDDMSSDAKRDIETVRDWLRHYTTQACLGNDPNCFACRTQEAFERIMSRGISAEEERDSWKHIAARTGTALDTAVTKLNAFVSAFEDVIALTEEEQYTDWGGEERHAGHLDAAKIVRDALVKTQDTGEPDVS